MEDFERMYFQLASKVATAIETLDNLSEKLKLAQLLCEAEFIERENPDIIEKRRN